MAAPDAIAEDGEQTMGLTGRQLAVRVAGAAVVVALVVAAVLTVPFLDGVRDRFAHAEPAWLVLTAACQLASGLSFVLALYAVFARRLPPRAALDIGYVEQGANVLLPTGGAGGIAIGAVALGRAGLDPVRVAARSVALFLLTSAASVATMAVAGIATALGLLGGDVALVGSLLPGVVGVIVLAAFALSPLVHHEPSEHTGRALRTLSRVLTTLRAGIADSIELLRHPDPLLLAGAVGYLWWDIASLAAAFQAFGGGAPAFGPFVLAYVVGQLGSLIPIPGGLGGTDGGLIGFLVVYGATGSAAAAAVLAFRVFQLGFPGTLGALALGRLRKDIDEVAELRRRRLAAEAS